MEMGRRMLALCALAGLAVALIGLTPGSAARPRLRGPATRFVVVFERDVSAARARAEIRRLGGRIVTENKAVGVATVRTSSATFALDAASSDVLYGAARYRAIGRMDPRLRPKDTIETPLAPGRSRPRPAVRSLATEPLSGKQWDMRMIHARDAGSYAVQPGDPRVLVGILDSGIDARHPDLRPNLNLALDVNFTRDIPSIDGRCRTEPDKSCDDPPGIDENGHGTHVAGSVAAALNGRGLSGTAPNVTLVSLRVGQDSGYVFLQPVVDALTYAADNGVDVVNMSFFIDPWQFNCPSNPADSPEAQAEQATTIEAVQRAVDYADSHNVTMVVANGNAAIDLANPTVDEDSPNFPVGEAYPREVDNSCLNLPPEADHVIAVTAVGPTGRKAVYSNYGLEPTDVAGPGGDFSDYFGTERHERFANMILSTYPKKLARQSSLISKKGRARFPFVKTDCATKKAKSCAVYIYFEGTSMAAPHVSGVASLIVSEFGSPEGDGLAMSPDAVRQRLQDSAVPHPCPDPNPLDYPDAGPKFTAFCEGDENLNGFYGNGIVDALGAVTAE
jgi:lantibiotic leader peptide-processing serine protease